MDLNEDPMVVAPRLMDEAQTKYPDLKPSSALYAIQYPCRDDAGLKLEPISEQALIDLLMNTNGALTHALAAKYASLIIALEDAGFSTPARTALIAAIAFED